LTRKRPNGTETRGRGNEEGRVRTIPSEIFELHGKNGRLWIRRESDWKIETKLETSKTTRQLRIIEDTSLSSRTKRRPKRSTIVARAKHQEETGRNKRKKMGLACAFLMRLGEAV
jgi:hypothetical protein